MARTRRYLDFKNAAEVVQLFKFGKILLKKQRLQTIKLFLGSDKTYAEVADIVRRHPNRVKLWANVFREGGFGKLLVRGSSSGRKTLMAATFQDALLEKLIGKTSRTILAEQLKGLDLPAGKEISLWV